MSDYVLPNVRKIFVPTTGHMLFDADLAGADAQVVAWECDDEDLKAAFRAKLDVHSHNAEAMWGAEFTRLDKSSDARKKKRQSCKHAVHGTNYGGSPRALAAHPGIGWTVHEAEQFQKRWFSLHPKIGPTSRTGSWHWRIEKQLQKNRTVRNAFGFHRIFFDRADQCFTEALAWVPQSTVALTTFKGAFALRAAISEVRFLLQVHDSLVFELPLSSITEGIASHIKKSLEVPIPYPDPLIISWGLKSSTTSWGDIKEARMGAEA